MSIFEEQQLEKWKKIAEIYKKGLLDIIEIEKKNTRSYVLSKMARDTLERGRK